VKATVIQDRRGGRSLRPGNLSEPVTQPVTEPVTFGDRPGPSTSSTGFGARVVATALGVAEHQQGEPGAGSSSLHQQ
jgi:hypothetical protein